MINMKDINSKIKQNKHDLINEILNDEKISMYHYMIYIQ